MGIDFDGAPQHRERFRPVRKHVGQRHPRSGIEVVPSVLTDSEATKAAIICNQGVRVRMNHPGLAYDIWAGWIFSAEYIERIVIEAEAHVIRGNLHDTLG